MKTAIVCMAKDEDHYIDEWIDYHLLLGFDKIFIYRDNWNYTSSNMKRDGVTVLDYAGKLNIPHNKKQAEVYNECAKNIMNEFDFLAILDVDEFINLQKHNNIKDFLINFSDVHSIYLTWRVFGDSHQTKVVDNNYSCINRFVSCCSWFSGVGKSIYNINKIKNDYLKNEKLEFNFGIHGAPNGNNLRCCTSDKSYFYKPEDNMGYIWNSPNFEEIKQHIKTSCQVAYINHYMCKTIEEYRNKYYRNSTSEWASKHNKTYTTPESSFEVKTKGCNASTDYSIQKTYKELKSPIG